LGQNVDTVEGNADLESATVIGGGMDVGVRMGVGFPRLVAVAIPRAMIVSGARHVPLVDAAHGSRSIRWRNEPLTLPPARPPAPPSGPAAFVARNSGGPSFATSCP